MENFIYNCTLTYVTCESFGRVYLFCINIYGRLYFPILPIKDLINEDGELTMPFKLETGTKTSLSNLHVLFCPYVVRKATAQVGTKTLNMYHQLQKRFHSIFVEITHNQIGYLVYVPHTRNIISSYDVVFDDIFSSELEYTSQPY